MARPNSGIDVDGFYDTLDALRSGSVPPVLVIAGDEALFRRQAVEALLAGIEKVAPGVQLVTFYGPASRNEAALPVATVLDELRLRSLFASQKLVLVRGAQLFLFPQKNEETAAKRGAATPEDELASYVGAPAEGMFLAFEVESVNRTRKTGKALAEHARIIDCPVLKWERDVSAWLRRAARQMGKGITPQAVSMLFLAHGAVPGALWQELEKCCIYVGAAEEISESAVREFLGDSIAFSAYELSNAIESRDLEKGLTLARRIVSQGISDKDGRSQDLTGSVHIVFGNIHACLAGIWQAQDVLAAGGGEGELADRLGPARFRARFLLEAARRYSGREIARAFAALAEAVASMHDTGSDAALALERIVVSICAKRGGAVR